VKGYLHRTASSSFSGAVAGEEVEDFCEGSFSHAHLYFFLSFALLYVTTQDFIKFWGKIFAFVLPEMNGNSQGFKTF
jgi:hypothetical protein